MMLEDNVQKLDEYFEGKKSNEKKLIFFAAFGVVAYGVYMLVNPYALEINQAASEELEKATSEYNKLSDELKNTKALIPRQIQDIKQNTANIQQSLKSILEIEKKLGTVGNFLLIVFIILIVGTGILVYYLVNNARTNLEASYNELVETLGY